MEHLYGSLFKTTGGAYGPLSTKGVVDFTHFPTAIECIWSPFNWEVGNWSYQPSHSLLLPRGLI